ncbi:MAG: oxygen-independent coproporphyrinogen III oxidase [Candidatus Thiodiazotropha sp. (ex Lucinoma aequizonata)]|nr:oxygen-independent coproporphyrinogen III oxidase [Candidatus Thiodiazotropha sp. (ex Lucinoma aequizonata)]MCU7888509.1 oxygen-independent coproporphyrinogen III oxidase [Candidatus Thiodiazotropha sp. (ex Lucinoma aequizonata)]MCU7893989.1 oxygen-independent coproporphyrinogen III oxidase [Candidatus Thiodiazotropha sp. (ex Lucinoma aequizonata)]MCU7899218.1 oxygen-independent coproporphyrinogen III oxidase [Candidatus Thiodiazotropha sp. (ex Lucinoma aequizonata)]MCU7902663.1 oxygen-indep
MDHSIQFDLAMIAKYDQSGPRYTSYPTAVQFHDGFNEPEYRRLATQSNETGQPLSLYFHIPFCDTVCFYCACNKVATKDRSMAASYLARVYEELRMQSELFDSSRVVTQLHWGGGTPTFISHNEMRELVSQIHKMFTLLDDDSGEYSIEIDPREAKGDTIKLLRELGFNRMSLGVQDFEAKVQKAVNRIQSKDETLTVLQSARDEGFRSISIDLIYGLPFQSMESFSNTLDQILEVDPDRLSVFNYAHLPERFKPQRRINEEELPPPQEKLDILQITIKKLSAAGYVYVGMDHFAKPNDELVLAQENGTLYRNFQGYSTHADCDLIGLGATSIGMVGQSYAQNMRSLDEYYQRIDSGRLAIFRGVKLTRDGLIRRDVITRLICNFSLTIPDVEKSWGVVFKDYFSVELQRLHEIASDGLISISDSEIKVLPRGRLLIRNICMQFDIYLNSKASQGSFSKVI